MNSHPLRPEMSIFYNNDTYLIRHYFVISVDRLLRILESNVITKIIVKTRQNGCNLNNLIIRTKAAIRF